MRNDKKFEKYYDYFNSPYIDDKTTKSSDVEEIIEGLNRSIEEQEENQKRFLRNKSFTLIGWLIWTQLIFFDLVVILILLPIIFRNDFFYNLSDNTISLLLDFLKYFIGATIVELLGMLFFVVKFVFSKYNRIDEKENN